MKHNKPYISLAVLILLSYVLIRVAYLYPKWDNPGTEATLSWDVFGYYLYLPAQFIYGDLDGLGFIDELFQTYRPAGDFHHAVQQPDGRYVMKYPIGMALMYLPFFLIGHLFAHLLDYPIDGLSLPYQYAIAMGSIAYSILGLLILRKVLLRYFSDLVTAITLGVIVLATNYLNYSAIDGPMTHNYLFTLYALLLWLTIRWHERPQRWSALAIGLTIGLATIVRPIELIAILIPLCWGITNQATFQKKLQLVWKNRIQVGLLAAGLIAMGTIQLIYWKYASGHWLYYSYGEQGFSWFRPHIINGLFSFRKGWFWYTPVMLFAMAGFLILLLKKERQFLLLALAAYVGINLYIVFAWDIWWYGGSLGSRPVIQSYAALAIPMAAFIAWVIQFKMLRVVAFAGMFLCMDLNMIMTWQAHAPGGGMHPELMTEAYYWKIFGSSRAQKADKKFLDVREELGSTRGMKIRQLFTTDFESDTLHITTNHKVSGQQAYQLDGSNQYSPNFVEISLGALAPKPKSWIRVRAQVMYTDIEWSEWNMAQLVTRFIRGNETYDWTGARIQRLMNPWQWHQLQYEVRVPRDYEEEDVLQVYLWNADGSRAVYADDIVVELLEPGE